MHFFYLEVFCILLHLSEYAVFNTNWLELVRNFRNTFFVAVCMVDQIASIEEAYDYETIAKVVLRFADAAHKCVSMGRNKYQHKKSFQHYQQLTGFND